LIGLAKREETIVFHDDRGELKLKASDPALRLLQRVRDEAHRFANRFNADLRSKKIKESILDDFPGLGKVRRAVLLENFDSIEKMRKASLEELSAVEGFGAKMAGRLFDFLKTGKTE
jgi:excinuclease ABC subunit C